MHKSVRYQGVHRVTAAAFQSDFERGSFGGSSAWVQPHLHPDKHHQLHQGWRLSQGDTLVLWPTLPVKQGISVINPVETGRSIAHIDDNVVGKKDQQAQVCDEQFS